MARRRGRNFSSGRGSRPVEWLRGQTALTTIPGVAAGVGAAVFDFTPTLFTTMTSPTLVRIRGTLSISGVTAGPPQMIPWAAGYVALGAKAIAAGVAAIPVPMSDDADWQWFAGGALGDAAPGVSPQEDVHSVMVDSKAMRRYEQSEDHIGFVFANHSGVVGADIFMHLAFSLLIKE